MVLAAHGSSRSAAPARNLRRHADTLVRRGWFDEAVATFWKQPPFFRDVLATVSASDITIVPLLTSRGYYYRRILPRELGLSGPITHRGGRVLRYTPPLGEHAGVVTWMRRCVDAAIVRHGLAASETGVVVIGHGTLRDPESGTNTRRQADALAATPGLGEVVAVFLDQPNRIEQTYALTRSRNLLIVPFLLGGAGHLLEDVPARLGLPARGAASDGLHEVNDRRVVILSALGEDEGLLELVFDLAWAIGTPGLRAHADDRATLNQNLAGAADA